MQKFPTVFANYWNNKWKKTTVLYSLKGGSKENVRNIFGHYNDEMVELANEFKANHSDEGSRAFAIFIYAKNNLKYVSDSTKHNRPEFWQKSSETHTSLTGDCEDGAIWINDMMMLAGIPAYRRKLCAGWVKASETAPLGGHAYCIFLANDLEWYVLDWCYYPTTCRQAWKKIPQRSLPYYKEIWWTTNEELSWAQKSTMVI